MLSILRYFKREMLGQSLRKGGLGYKSVAQRPNFESALRVVKIVLNPQSIYIFGLQCGFMQKNPKKHSKNQNRRICSVNLAPGLRNDQKLPKKNGSLNRDLLNFFLHRYGIFWVPPGESSCPGGSEYV